MKNLKKRRRIQVIVLAFVALGLATALIGYAARDGINVFRSPSQIAAEPPDASEVFRIGGLVVENSIEAGQGTQFSFLVTDCVETYQVNYVGDEGVPALFVEGQGTVATGRLINGVFEATQVLAKHDESYQPREVTNIMGDEPTCESPHATDGADALN